MFLSNKLLFCFSLISLTINCALLDKAISERVIKSLAAVETTQQGLLTTEAQKKFNEILKKIEMSEKNLLESSQMATDMVKK